MTDRDSILAILKTVYFMPGIGEEACPPGAGIGAPIGDPAVDCPLPLGAGATIFTSTYARSFSALRAS